MVFQLGELATARARLELVLATARVRQLRELAAARAAQPPPAPVSNMGLATARVLGIFVFIDVRS